MRNWFIISFMAGAIAIGATLSATAAPRFSKGTSTSGAVVYQDDQDPTQFYYLPLATQALLGDRLKNFKASYFGIGPAFYVQSANGQLTQRTGGIVSGTYSINISDAQRTALLQQIKKDFNIDNAKLLPLVFRDVVISSTVVDNIIAGGDQIQQKLPTTTQIGTEFNFGIGSLNSLFPTFLANQQWSVSTTLIQPGVGV